MWSSLLCISCRLPQVSICLLPIPQVLVHVVSALFDINPSMSTHMPLHLWKKCVSTLFNILDLLAAHPYITMDEDFDGGEVERTGTASSRSIPGGCQRWCRHLNSATTLARSMPHQSLHGCLKHGLKAEH